MWYQFWQIALQWIIADSLFALRGLPESEKYLSSMCAEAWVELHFYGVKCIWSTKYGYTHQFQPLIVKNVFIPQRRAGSWQKM